MQKVVLALLIAAVAAVPAIQLHKLNGEESALFAKFKSQYNKTYLDKHEELYRQQVFASNLQFIRQHNMEEAAGQHTYTVAMNEFGDLTFEEFHAKYTGFSGLRGEFIRSQNIAQLSAVNAPTSVDWTAKGAVTAVKDQGQCGSCWSFSATGSIESAWYIAKGQLVSLSEQQLMDCSKGEGNDSCEGGWMDYAFEYVIQNGGICTEASYPYTAQDHNSCTSCKPVVTISSYSDIAQTEDALTAAVAQQPVSVAIEADQTSFQFYSGGVMTGTCGTNLDHGVLAVGYGFDSSSGVNYWKVKNSWGASWGESGYIRFQKGKQQYGAQCGITLAASFPIV